MLRGPSLATLAPAGVPATAPVIATGVDEMRAPEPGPECGARGRRGREAGVGRAGEQEKARPPAVSPGPAHSSWATVLSLLEAAGLPAPAAGLAPLPRIGIAPPARKGRRSVVAPGGAHHLVDAFGASLAYAALAPEPGQR